MDIFGVVWNIVLLRDAPWTLWPFGPVRSKEHPGFFGLVRVKEDLGFFGVIGGMLERMVSSGSSVVISRSKVALAEGSSMQGKAWRA